MTDLPDVLAAVTLDPDDRLLVVLPYTANLDQMDETAKVAAGVFGEGRVAVAAGIEDVIVLRATKAEGSTVGQCGARSPSVFSDSTLTYSCHLAAGHSGMHSDGTATWTDAGGA